MKTPPASQPADDRSESEPAIPEIEAENYRSEELFRGRKEVLIVHNDEVYRLRRTRNDKLILYK